MKKASRFTTRPKTEVLLRSGRPAKKPTTMSINGIRKALLILATLAGVSGFLFLVLCGVALYSGATFWSFANAVAILVCVAFAHECLWQRLNLRKKEHDMTVTTAGH